MAKKKISTDKVSSGMTMPGMTLDEKYFYLEHIHRINNTLAVQTERFRNMDDKFNHMNEKFDLLIHQMDKRFDQVDKRFEQVDKRIGMQTYFISFGFTFLATMMTLYKFIA